MNSKPTMLLRSAVMLGIAVVFTLALSVVIISTKPNHSYAQGKPSTELSKDEIKKAKRFYLRKTCAACHGRNGARAIMNNPNIAGQDEKYMLAQINDIIKGKRVGGIDENGYPRSAGMHGALVTAEGEVRISDDEIKLITKWLASQKPAIVKKLEVELTSDEIKEALRLYKKGNCKSCHGVDGKKPLKKYPYIAGQKVGYISAQLSDIRDKTRKNGLVKLMYPFVRKLTDEQIELLARYLSQIERDK